MQPSTIALRTAVASVMSDDAPLTSRGARSEAATRVPRGDREAGARVLDLSRAPHPCAPSSISGGAPRARSSSENRAKDATDACSIAASRAQASAMSARVSASSDGAVGGAESLVPLLGGAEPARAPSIQSLRSTTGATRASPATRNGRPQHPPLQNV